MIVNPFDYYIRVAELMKKDLPKPKHRSRFIINDGEILPIITVETGI